jgi:hypothetical protein
MSEVILDSQDEYNDLRWAALFIRHACRPNTSFKAQALSGPSLNTIEKQQRLPALLDITDDQMIAREVNHKQIMLKTGLKIGLSPAVIGAVL